MGSESLPKQFESTTEVLPMTSYGLSSLQEYSKYEVGVQQHERLRRAGLTDDELKLFYDNEAGMFCQNVKMEATVLKKKLAIVQKKIKSFQDRESSEPKDDISTKIQENIPQKWQDSLSISFYPEGHPMNSIKEMEQNLFGHLKYDKLPITKRRKMLRRLERKKDRLLSRESYVPIHTATIPTVKTPGSLWDVTDTHIRQKVSPIVQKNERPIIGPKQPTMYTIKDKTIVKLEPIGQSDEYRTVDIKIPTNSAEKQLLEGTKMALDDIKVMDRFKNYDPGLPSKVLYIKNIDSSVSQERLSILFNQFRLENGGPINVRLMSGRMRGQAFVVFQNETIAIRALEEVNGTILSGKPLVIHFGRNSNRIQTDSS